MLDVPIVSTKIALSGLRSREYNENFFSGGYLRPKKCNVLAKGYSILCQKQSCVSHFLNKANAVRDFRK